MLSPLEGGPMVSNSKEFHNNLSYTGYDRLEIISTLITETSYTKLLQIRATAKCHCHASAIQCNHQWNLRVYYRENALSFFVNVIVMACNP